MTASTHENKPLTRPEAVRRAADGRRRGQCVVLTTGCFDILHAGRPLNSQADRAGVLAAQACVDVVTCFNAPDPLELVMAIAPDVLVKGADWAEADIVGADSVKAAGGRVRRIDLLPERSTTALICRILDRHGAREGAVG